MTFKSDDLMVEIKKDNPTYERILTSDLHALVELLKKTPLKPPADIAAEMRKVSDDKWKKYAKARAYILKEIPAVEDFLFAQDADPKTIVNKYKSDLDKLAKYLCGDVGTFWWVIAGKNDEEKKKKAA